MSGRDGEGRACAARFLLPYESIKRIEPSPKPRLVSARRWRHVARAVLAGARPHWSSLCAAARADLTPYPYQLEPALAMTRGDGCRFLIADAVGLGKTVQAGLMLAETLSRRAEAKGMIVCPAGLREQWRSELRRRFSLSPEIVDAATLARLQSLLPPDVNPWAVSPVSITSIDFVKRPEVLRALEALTWDMVIIDEAHHLCGRSGRAAASAMLALRARVVVLLTATPHSGDEAQFSRLCGIGSGSDGSPLVVFRRTRAAARADSPTRSVFLFIRRTHEEIAAHDALMSYARRVWEASPADADGGARLAVSVLLRRASSSAASLSRSVARRLELLSSGAAVTGVQGSLPFDADSDDVPDLVLGARGLGDAGQERALLEHVLRLAQAAEARESKVCALVRFLRRTREPAIVFTEYRDTLHRLAAVFDHHEAVQLHGGLTSRDRSQALRRFTEGDARLLLATDAGSEGLNLHHRCRLVINLELPWTPMRLEQRIGRVDRIGQTRRVHAIHLVGARSWEETTLVRLVERKNRIRATMEPLKPLADERQVAESAVTGGPCGDGPTPVLLPEGLTTVDLRREAKEEASRILRARRLFMTGHDAAPDSRPVLTRLGSRRRRQASPCAIWLFQVVFTNPEREQIWEAIIPMSAALSRRPMQSVALQAVLDPSRLVIQDHLRSEADSACRRLNDSLANAVPLWVARERGIVTELRSKHARLSAVLLQPALFYSGPQRHAAFQEHALKQALAGCQQRLIDLQALVTARADSTELLLAALLA